MTGGGGDVAEHGAAASAVASRFIPVQSDHGLSAVDQSIAGAAAKAATKFILYPLDTWKTRRQASNPQCFSGLWTVRGVYRGLVPKVALYTPYQAIYMAVYVRVRDALLADVTGNPCAAFVVAGVVAEISGSVVRLPMEVAKVRMQLGMYRSTWHAMCDFVLRPAGLFHNFVPQTLAHDCAYSACSWLAFEYGRQRLFRRNQSDELRTHESLLLGTMTGALSAAATTPLDVIKTRIIGAPGSAALGERRGVAAGSEAPVSSLGVRAAAVQIWRTDGFGAFWRGCGLRVAHLAPSSGVYFLLYEAAKKEIARWRGVGRPAAGGAAA